MVLEAFGWGGGNQVQGVSQVILVSLLIRCYSLVQENIAEQIRQIIEIENLEEVFF